MIKILWWFQHGLYSITPVIDYSSPYDFLIRDSGLADHSYPLRGDGLVG
jgi:hypothetical protein